MANQYLKPPRFGPLRRTYIKEWREARGLSQDDLASAMETTKATVSRIETERNAAGVTQAFLETAAAVIGCEPWDLLMHPPDDAAFDREWLTELSGLRADERRQAIGHIRLIRESRRKRDQGG